MTSVVVPPFNLETYISRYSESSECRLQRLLFIAGVARETNDPSMTQNALVLAEKQMKDTQNVLLYKRVFSAGSTTIGYDELWAQQTQALIDVAMETLEGRLSAAQTHLHKETIRTAYLALGQYARERGDLERAMRSILRSKDYCINRAQTSQVCMTIIELALDMKNFQQAHEFVFKAGHSTAPGPGEAVFRKKLKVAAGIAYIGQARFAEAAKQLTCISSAEHEDGSICEGLPATAQDISTYTILCGLATLDRNQLKQLLETQNSLDLTPALRDALAVYCRADYPECIGILKRLHSTLKLDMILGPHLNKLFHEIRNKCLVEYLLPYNKVDLKQAATTFCMSPQDLHKVLADLLAAERIVNARIDCRSETLVRFTQAETVAAAEAKMAQRLVAMEQKVVVDTYSMMIRVACMESETGRRSNKNAPFHIDDMSEEDGDEPMPLVAGNPEDIY